MAVDNLEILDLDHRWTIPIFFCRLEFDIVGSLLPDKQSPRHFGEDFVIIPTGQRVLLHAVPSVRHISSTNH